MRFALIASAVAALAACTQQPAQARCDIEVTRTIAFTAPDAEDTVTAMSHGPSCDKAIGVLTVRDAEGHPVWAWTSPLPRAFGEVFAAEDGDAMRAFIERWAEPVITSTQTAPEWRGLTFGQTTLDRATYDDIRARELPMLCHYIGTARQGCVFWEPAAGGAGHFFDRHVEEDQQ